MTLQMAADGDDRVRRLSASGELDVTVVPAMLSEVSRLVSGAEAVVLDLTDVTFFDSSGVRLVDRMARECGRIGTPIRVVAPPGTPPRRVLEMVVLTEGLVADDVPAAVAAVTAAG